MIENAHKHLERAEPGQAARRRSSSRRPHEVGPALFFCLLIITVSFMPIFTLESQEGRLFGPLAFTKTFSMAAAALLSVTLVPVLMVLFVRGRIIPEHKNPLNRFLIWIYRPVITGGAAREGAHDPRLRWPFSRSAIWPARQLGTRVHAEPQRGHAALHADDAARDFDHQGGGAAADAGPHHQDFPEVAPSTARRAAPRPRPIRRQRRCSRPSST